MSNDARRGDLFGTGVGPQNIETVPTRFGLDQLFPAVPPQRALIVDCILEILVSLKPLQHSPYLAGEFLRVDLLALYRRHPFELGFGLGQSSRAPLLVPLLSPRSAGNHVALVLPYDFHDLGGIPELRRLLRRQL